MTLQIDLGARSYEIGIDSQWLDRASEWIEQSVSTEHTIVITDENVETLHATSVAQSLVDGGAGEVDLVVVGAGETSKSIDVAEQLWQQMLKLGADRKSLIVAVGGGVVGDLAGFIAATYARGLSFVQVPTTLLAQVDSSVGGKVAINLPDAKNMVGAFWQPAAVLIDTHTLSTLPKREYCAGMGEVVKYGVVLDGEFFTFLEQHVDAINARDNGALRELVRWCCRLKADVVEQDECEQSGRRAILNYGHTFGHALEAVAGYGNLLHGEGVSIGMMCAARLAQSLQLVDSQFIDRQQRLLSAFDLPIEMPALEIDAVIQAMQRDKKVEHGAVRFVLPTEWGAGQLVSDVDPELVRAALQASP